ncbi:uncharacterized protein At2g39910 [Typha latifolia]|uniref:uncharacterized protein At2g39910 n=1 Tax=Typha latifolia TaxID=4733 RepID=UPI003C2CA41C
MAASRNGSGSPKCHSLSRHHLVRLSDTLHETLARTPYNPPEGASISIKSLLESLLPSSDASSTKESRREINDFFLCCAALAAAEGDESPALYWIPRDLCLLAKSALKEMAGAASYGSEGDMIVEMVPEILPEVKRVIKESCVDTEEEEFLAASAKAPVEKAVVAGHQLRWMVSQVCYPKLGNLCWLVIPCALTALDHWSPEVKEQGMASFVHVSKNVTATELSWYEEAILDACCRNIPASDELWYRVVEVSVLLLTCTQRNNPRSLWFEQMLNEMLGHLERQPYNKERRIAWLTLIEPIFNAMGLLILAHFRRLFPLFLQWMHADDDKTIILVLERLGTIVQLTWVRQSPYTERLVDELILLYKESATRRNREVLRDHILQMLTILQKCKGLQFESAWDKHKNDPDLLMLLSSHKL